MSGFEVHELVDPLRHLSGHGWSSGMRKRWMPHLGVSWCAKTMRMVCKNSWTLDLNSNSIRSSPKFSLEASSTLFSFTFLIKSNWKFAKILSRAMDGTSGRHLVCENYANGMRSCIKIQEKPKHIRWLLSDFQQAQVLACGVSVQISCEVHQHLLWPWMVFWYAKAMDGHIWASFGMRKLCEWYANGMRKQIKTQVKPKHIRWFLIDFQQA